MKEEDKIVELENTIKECEEKIKILNDKILFRKNTELASCIKPGKIFVNTFLDYDTYFYIKKVEEDLRILVIEIGEYYVGINYRCLADFKINECKEVTEIPETIINNLKQYGIIIRL